MTPPVTKAARDAARAFHAVMPGCRDALAAAAVAIAEETARASRLLNDRAAVLRTREGRAKAEWHEEDALMVAHELDRQATAIRAPVGEVGNG